VYSSKVIELQLIEKSTHCAMRPVDYSLLVLSLKICKCTFT